MKTVLNICLGVILVCSATSLNFSPLSKNTGTIAENATIEDYPYQVSLDIVNSHYCSGAILSPNVILTSGHCADGLTEMSYTTVRAGSTIKNRGGVVRSIVKTIIHEKYDFNFTLDYNVALLFLNESLDYSSQIQPIALPDETEYLEENELVVFTGWWCTLVHTTGNHPKILQKVEYPTINQNKCIDAYANDKLITILPRMFCAGVLNEDGKEACIGDSGGPLVVNGKVHGIAIVGYGCKTGMPGVATRVTSVREWIRSKVDL